MQPRVVEDLVRDPVAHARGDGLVQEDRLDWTAAFGEARRKRGLVDIASRGSKPSSDMGGDAVTSPRTSLMRPNLRGSVYASAMPLSKVTTSLAKRGGQFEVSTTKALYFIAPFPGWKMPRSCRNEKRGESAPPLMSHHICLPRRCAAVRVLFKRAETKAFRSTSLKIFSSKLPSSLNSTLVTLAPMQCASTRHLALSTSGSSGMVSRT